MSKEDRKMQLVADILERLLYSVMMEPSARGPTIEKLGRLQELIHTDEEA